MNDFWLAVFRLAINAVVGIGAIMTARKLLQLDRRLVIRGVALFMLGASAYNILAAVIFAYTSWSGSFMVFGVQAGWFYAGANAFEAIPLFVLVLIFQGIIKTDNIDDNVIRLNIALDAVRGIRGSAVWDAMPADVKERVEIAEDAIGNLTAKMQGIRDMYERREELWAKFDQAKKEQGQ